MRFANHAGYSAGWFVARGVGLDSEEYGVNLLYSVVGECMVLVKGQSQSIPRNLGQAPWKSLNGRNPDLIGRMVAFIPADVCTKAHTFGDNRQHAPCGDFASPRLSKVSLADLLELRYANSNGGSNSIKE